MRNLGNKCLPGYVAVFPNTESSNKQTWTYRYCELKQLAIFKFIQS